LPANRGFFAFLTKTERKNMKRNKTKVRTTFVPEIRFELRPAPEAPFRALQETEFEELKQRLLARQLTLAPAAEFVPNIRRAANEAAALAWATVFPLLVFPVLFEEKTEAGLNRLEKQAHVYKNSRELLPV
jgi:hypothetical protein